jgi:hypothetical protein
LTRKQLLADKDISRIEKIMNQNIDNAEQSGTSPLIIKCSVLLSAVFMHLEKSESRNSVETTDFDSMLDDILGRLNLSSKNQTGIQNIINIILNDNEIKDNEIASVCHKVKAILDII